MCLVYFGRWLIEFVPTASMFVILSWQLVLLAVAHQKALLRKFGCTKHGGQETWLRERPPPKKEETKYQGHISGCQADLTAAIAIVITNAKHWLPVSWRNPFSV